MTYVKVGFVFIVLSFTYVELNILLQMPNIAFYFILKYLYVKKTKFSV